MMQPPPPANTAKVVANEATRNSFRVVFDLRRSSLTEQEVEFLEGLLNNGTEEEINQCHKRLSDPTLFPAESKSQNEEDSFQSTAVASKFTSNSGSARRRESLHLRKTSLVHGQIWKAHQNGLAVSRQASRRSIYLKEQIITTTSRKSIALTGIQEAGRNKSLGFDSFHTALEGDWSDSDDDNDEEEGPTIIKPKQRSSIRTPKQRSSIRMSLRTGRLPPSSIRSSSRSSVRSSVTFRRGSSMTLSGRRTSTEVALSKAESLRRRQSLHQQKSGSQRRATLEALDEKEEKKLDDEEMVHTAEWQQQLTVRRASTNVYMGEGMEVDFMAQAVQEEEVMSESEVISESETYEEEEDGVSPLPSLSSQQRSNHAMIMRRASVNTYQGMGMEIADWDLQEDLEERRGTLEDYRQSPHHVSQKMLPEEEAPVRGITRSASFDETQSMDRLDSFPAVGPGMLQRSYSEDELAAVLTLHLHRTKRNLEKRGSAATVSTTESDEGYDDFEYDAWDEEVNQGMGNLPFRILGTSADDADCIPHVLSPPLMESLQEFMPLAKTSDNYWLKYSMLRDGASMHTLLQHARGAKHSILAIETVDGEVMGSFTNEPWRKTWSYFGGGESFLWRMRHSRKTKCHSIIDVAHLESEIDVYPYTGENHCVQFCTAQKIAVGGGSPDEAGAQVTWTSMKSLTEEGGDNQDEEVRDHEWGHGIALQDDFMQGSSSPCVTFGSPSLSKLHSDGSLFEIINIELWTMTPCFSEADAQKLELGKMFLEQQSFQSTQSNEDLNQFLYG